MPGRLIPSDFRDIIVCAHDPATGRYLGRKSDARLWQVNENSYTNSILYDFPANLSIKVQYVWVSSTGAYLAHCTDTATSVQNYLYRSTDKGASWTQVLQLGYNSVEGHIPRASQLTDRTTGEFTINGQKVWLAGEYNINLASHGRVDGSTLDRVQLWKSTDDGATWSVACTWNVGSNTVRHIHCVRQDPYTGEIYIGFGDTDAQSGLIVWDGVTPWADNIAPSASNRAGFRGIGGAQRYRSCDFAFTQNFVFLFADASNATPNEVGIWRFRRDLSNYVRVDSSLNTSYPVQAGFFAISLGPTSAIFCAYCDSSVAASDTTHNIGVWRTDDDGVTVKQVAKFCCLGTLSGGMNIFAFWKKGTQLIMAVSNPAGKVFDATAFCTISDDPHYDSTPDTIHPVYWISPGGTDGSTNGHRPGDPWATLSYALTSDHVTNGAAVFLTEGMHTDSGELDMSYAANARPGYTSNPLVIRGAGMGKTTLALNTGGKTFGILCEDADGDVTFQDIRVRVMQPTAFPTKTAAGYTHNVTLRGAVIDYPRFR